MGKRGNKRRPSRRGQPFAGHRRLGAAFSRVAVGAETQFLQRDLLIMVAFVPACGHRAAGRGSGLRSLNEALGADRLRTNPGMSTGGTCVGHLPGRCHMPLAVPNPPF